MKEFVSFLIGLILGLALIVIIPFERNMLMKYKTKLILDCEKHLPRDKNCIIVLKAIVKEKK